MLSIVTINFNNAHGLKKTIESLAPLRASGFEWVFVDGGSNDASLELAKSFSLPGDILTSESDAGIYNAMNRALRMPEEIKFYF